VAKRKYLRLGFAIAAILLFFLLLNASTHSQAIAEMAFRKHCDETHGDFSSYSMVYDKVDLWGHYYDFSVATPADTRPGVMGFYRVYVTWIGTSSVRGFKGRPF
jgi:hypothetical protein